MPFTQNEHDMAVKVGGHVMLALVCILVGYILLAASCSATLTADDDMPAYDYAGPDGTLTGVPYTLRNYVVVDHDTGVYYFLLQDPETGNIALCPRLEADGKPWQKPTYERGE
jgi:hypothetical protein